jgi:hypothetical protein
MTSAVQLTINALLAQAGVIAVTSTRIKPFPLPQGLALPAIAVAMSAEDDAYTLAGASQYPETSVQIHCIALTASAAIESGERVKEGLRDLLYTSSDSPPVKASFQKEPIDFTDFSDDLSTHRRVMGFSLRWR